MFLIVLDGVRGETLWGGESRARNHTHKRERKAGQAAVERTTVQQWRLIVSRFVRRRLIIHKCAQRVAGELVQEAIDQGSRDNTSAIICMLHQHDLK